MTYAEFILAAKAIHGNKYIYPDQEFLNKYTPIRIICKKHGIFYQKPNYHLTGGGCKKCAIEADTKRKYMSREQFIQKCKKLFPNYNYDTTIYIGTHNKVTVICDKHGEFTTLASNLLAGHGCPRCYSRAPTKESFITAAKSIFNDLYDYSKVEYKNNITKVEIICKKHGSFYMTPGNHLSGRGCPKCQSSKGERKIREVLTELNIAFIEQKRFSDCKDKNPLPFDFYLPDYNLCIEYQGEQHYIPVKRGHMTEEQAIIQLKAIQRRDLIKKNYCHIKNISLLEISYKDDLQNVLKVYLKELKG